MEKYSLLFIIIFELSNILTYSPKSDIGINSYQREQNIFVVSSLDQKVRYILIS